MCLFCYFMFCIEFDNMVRLFSEPKWCPVAHKPLVKHFLLLLFFSFFYFLKHGNVCVGVLYIWLFFNCVICHSSSHHWNQSCQPTMYYQDILSYQYWTSMSRVHVWIVAINTNSACIRLVLYVQTDLSYKKVMNSFLIQTLSALVLGKLYPEKAENPQATIQSSNHRQCNSNLNFICPCTSYTRAEL